MLNKFDLFWFIGFSVGDGSFILPKNNKKCFEIWQHVNDIDLLYFLQSSLTLGNIRVYPYRPNIAVFNINKKEELQQLYRLFENNICTLNTKLRFENLSNKVINFNKPLLTIGWLSGFLDAEGCFRIKYEKTGSLKLIFEISQKEEEILIQIKELLKITTKIRKAKDKNHWILSIDSLENRNSLIEYLERHPLCSHKKIIFEKWKSLNQLVINKKIPITRQDSGNQWRNNTKIN